MPIYDFHCSIKTSGNISLRFIGFDLTCSHVFVLQLFTLSAGGFGVEDECQGSPLPSLDTVVGSDIPSSRVPLFVPL